MKGVAQNMTEMTIPSMRKDLKDAGLKVTGQRVTILKLFYEKNHQHLSAEEVYRILIGRGSHIGMATVYRVLSQLQRARILIRHRFEDGQAVYELDDHDHHDHMVDLESGEVVEFQSVQIEKAQEAIAAEEGYEIVDHELVLWVRKR